MKHRKLLKLGQSVSEVWDNFKKPNVNFKQSNVTMGREAKKILKK